MSRHLIGEGLLSVVHLNLPLLITVVEQDQRMAAIRILEGSIGHTGLFRFGGGDAHGSRFHHSGEMTNNIIMRVTSDGLVV